MTFDLCLTGAESQQPDVSGYDAGAAGGGGGDGHYRGGPRNAHFTRVRGDVRGWDHTPHRDQGMSVYTHTH